MIGISETSNHILLQNKHVQIYISKADASAQQIIDLKSGKNMLADAAPFFGLVNEDGTFVPNTGVTVSGNVLEIATALGSFSVQVAADEDYFAFTLLTALPEGTYKGYLANAKYTYDYTDKANTGACGLALTYWTNPVFYPDCKDLETRGEVIHRLQDKDAKYALIIAPINLQKDIIKKACLTIDKNAGLVSEIGGAWGRDSRLNFGNYFIEWENDQQYVHSVTDFYKLFGLDQIDLHQWEGSFRQGDFKFALYKDAADFKKQVTDFYAKDGLSMGLHTYSFYIRNDCDTILANPKWQKDLGVLETFVLAKDISADADFVPTTESTEEVSSDYGFTARNTSFILVGEEMMKFENAPDGFKIVERGWAGTKAVAHKAGEAVKHIDGYYRSIAPVIGSELFMQIARDTAKAYNEGGFKMIYLDALDGIRMHCPQDSIWYYTAKFVCEIMKYCDTTPLIEYSFFFPAIWAARGRVGAYDYPTRSYKLFNKIHAEDNLKYIDRYSAPTMGWYDFYPMFEKFPGNEHIKYHHTDAMHHLGSISLMNDFSIVHAATLARFWPRYAGLRRNATIYKLYDDLRKAAYFPAETLEKVKNGKWEYHLKQKENGEYVFMEKDFQIVKLYDLEDKDRNVAKFNNPFGKQLPFIRIEALLSTAGKNSIELMHFDENKDLTEQPMLISYDKEVDLNQRMAKKVRIKGNGIPGGTICIQNRRPNIKSERGYLGYIIDTDFEGWREFTLVETDVGEREGYPYDFPNDTEYKPNISATFRSQMSSRLYSQTQIRTTGDMTGVRMGDITACNHIYEILKNPTVQIGDTRIMFECELKSTDFIEFDGETAKVVDRYGNEHTIWYETNLEAPSGDFTATLTATPLNGTVARAQLTLGFTGKEL